MQKMQQMWVSIPRLGRSSAVGNGNPFQYSRWKIPWTEEPGGLQSMGLQRVRRDGAHNTHIKNPWLTSYLTK